MGELYVMLGNLSVTAELVALLMSISHDNFIIPQLLNVKRSLRQLSTPFFRS